MAHTSPTYFPPIFLPLATFPLRARSRRARALLITSQNAALTNEAVAVNILGRRMADTVLLIEALGGGWDRSQLAQTTAASAASAPNAPSFAMISLEFDRHRTVRDYRPSSFSDATDVMR